MMTNSLKAGYIKGRRLRKKGVEELGERDTSVVRKKPSREERDLAWISLVKKGALT